MLYIGSVAHLNKNSAARNDELFCSKQQKYDSFATV
jgi:hypothetical protein